MDQFLLLSQTEAAQVMGLTISQFLGRKKHFKTNGLTNHGKKYYIPIELLPEDFVQQNRDLIVDSEDSSNVLRQLSLAADVGGDISQIDLQQARRQKILKETEYLSQKITAKKQELFSQWSERFFITFQKSFRKFKNCLVNLHLNQSQITFLNENLEYAISNMQNSLDQIKSSYINTQQTDEEV